MPASDTALRERARELAAKERPPTPEEALRLAALLPPVVRDAR